MTLFDNLISERIKQGIEADFSVVDFQLIYSYFVLLKRVLMGLTDRRKTAKNLVDSRKNWKVLTVSRK